MPNTCVNYEKKCGGCPLLALPYREQLAKNRPACRSCWAGLPRSRPCRAWPSRCTTATRPLPALPPSEANSSAACMPRAPTASCPARTAFCQEEILNKTLAAVLDAPAPAAGPPTMRTAAPAFCAIPCCAAPATVRCWSRWSRPVPTCPAARISARLCAKKRLGSSALCRISTPPAPAPCWAAARKRSTAPALCGYAVRHAVCHFVPQLLPGQPHTDRGFVQESAGACQADGPRDGY